MATARQTNHILAQFQPSVFTQFVFIANENVPVRCAMFLCACTTDRERRTQTPAPDDVQLVNSNHTLPSKKCSFLTKHENCK